MIPQFDESGLLPAGIHACTWEEIEAKLGFNPVRTLLIEGLKRAARALKDAGCGQLYIDGSFVTEKREPGDFDGCWSIADVDEALIDPVLLDFAHERLLQKIKYRGELFPAELVEGRTGLTWLEFFQNDKDTGEPKGILLIDLHEEIP